MRKGKLPWAKAIRRIFALFFATLAFWLLGITCDLGSACARLGESSAFISALLRTELGPDTWNEGSLGQLDYWQRLAVSQSALLQAGQDLPGSTPSPSPTASSAGSEDSEEEPPPDSTAAPDDILERTILASELSGCIQACGVSLLNYTEMPTDLEAITAAQPNLELEQDGPQILIVHTHGSEAYTMDGNDVYEESDAYRTTDERYNVVRIGDEMQRVFEAMGLQVVHDRTLYDYPQYVDAYTRSREGVEKWLAKYPSIQVVLDVHRDGLVGEDNTIIKPVTDADGTKTAQLLLIVGTNAMGQDHPNWTQNLALAIRIQQQMDAQWPTLARPITLRSALFNQQLAPGSLLVEVGSHGNTLQEALQAARLFAKAAGEALLELE